MGGICGTEDLIETTVPVVAPSTTVPTNDNSSSPAPIDSTLDAARAWFQDADGDGFGNPSVSLNFATQPAEYVANNHDCNDNCASCHPGGTEVCDAMDNDCDGTLDDGVGQQWYRDADGDGYGEPNNTTTACSQPQGFVSNNQDCNDNCASCHPGGFEVCDGMDNDCDGTPDDGVGQRWYRDADGDGYGDPNNTTTACSQPQGYVSNNQDCNDNCASCHPGGSEVCDGKDNSCDGQTDEGYVCGTMYITAAEWVWKARLDGSSVEAISRLPDGSFGLGVTMDRVGGFLYFMYKDGSAFCLGKRQTSDPNAPGFYDVLFSKSATTSPLDVAYHSGNLKLYWTGVSSGTVTRCNTSGASETTIYGEGAVQGIAVGGGYAFWSRESSGQNYIRRSNLYLESPIDIMTGLTDRPRHFAVDTTSQKIFWTDSARRIWSATIDGANKQSIYLSSGGNVVGIAVHPAARKIYWCEQAPDKVRRANLDGSFPEDLITSGITSPHDIVLDVDGAG